MCRREAKEIRAERFKSLLSSPPSHPPLPADRKWTRCGLWMVDETSGFSTYKIYMNIWGFLKRNEFVPFSAKTENWTNFVIVKCLICYKNYDKILQSFPKVLHFIWFFVLLLCYPTERILSAEMLTVYRFLLLSPCGRVFLIAAVPPYTATAI